MNTSKVQCSTLRGIAGLEKRKQLNRWKGKPDGSVAEREPLRACTEAAARKRRDSGVLTRVARRSGVAGAVAGAAEIVPRLPAPPAVLAVVGHAPAGRRVHVCDNQTEVKANRS